MSVDSGHKLRTGSNKSLIDIGIEFDLFLVRIYIQNFVNEEKKIERFCY